MRVLCLPDVHLRKSRLGQPSGEDRKVIKTVFKYLSDHQWDKIILLGDLLDLPYFYSKEQDVSKDEALEYYKEDLRLGHEFLGSIRVMSDAEIILLQGNHDYRTVTYTNKHKELRDNIQLERDLRLDDFGVKWIPYWEDKSKFYKVGKACFGHGEFHNEHHAHKHATRYPGVNFFYGHVHDVQSHTPPSLGRGCENMAASLGCLCNYYQPYLRGSSTNWQHAFGVFHFRPNGYFNHYVVRVVKGGFISPEGKSYKG